MPLPEHCARGPAGHATPEGPRGRRRRAGVITKRGPRSLGAGLGLVATLLAPAVALAEILVPPGFTAQIYVTGDGFETPSGSLGRGIPSTATLAVDHMGALYLARTGRRYGGGEFEYLSRMYRIPAGGARLTPATEARYLHGPPLTNTQVSGGRSGRDLLLTTFDRDRRVGALYRLANGRAQLLAGGTPEGGQPPLLVQPEGTAVDAAGHVYVADRDRGVIVRLGADGHVLDSSYLRVTRPRVLAVDETDHLWIGSDGRAEAPWQAGTGQLWRVGPGGAGRLVLEGPMAQGLAPGPGGIVFVADRQGPEIFAVTPDGSRVSFARFTDGQAPRGLAFVPATEEARAAGLAGDLLVAVIRTGVFQLNEIVRISGPFADLVQRHLRATENPGGQPGASDRKP
jgi:NHL repeat-containing protein